MRTNPKPISRWDEPSHGIVPDMVRRLAPPPNDDDDADGGQGSSKSTQRDELPYRVELWNDAKTAVEQVLAVTRNGSIGYAAYYEATRQFPDRYVTLRHQGRILSRFNGPTH